MKGNKILKTFDKKDNAFANCILYSIWGNKKYLSIFRTSSQNDYDDLKSLEDYNNFCTVALWNGMKMKVEDVNSLDTNYSIMTYMQDAIKKNKLHITFNNYNPEKSYEILNDGLNNHHLGRMYLPIDEINDNTPNGYYWCYNTFPDLKETYYSMNPSKFQENIFTPIIL